jgi:hypothetical protein
MQPNRKTKEYLKSLTAITMSEGVRSRLRNELDAYVDLHAVQAPISIPAIPAIRSPFAFSYSRVGFSAFALVILLLVGGTGAAYASEGSVPGNILYPVKISVIEPVQGALISTTQGQAAWHAQLASARLDEATTLASTNKLDSATQQYLQTQFEAQVNASDAAATSLEASGKVADALDARSDLEARITAHAELLAVVSNHFDETSASSTPTAESTKALLAVVDQRKNDAHDALLALEDTLHSDTTASVVTLARAEVTTETVANAAADEQNVEPIASRVTAARAALTQAQEAGSGGSLQADQDAHEAERSSQVASILLKHAGLLKAFAPHATSTHATSTEAVASSTDANPSNIELQSK